MLNKFLENTGEGCSIGHVTSHMGHVTGRIDIDGIVVLYGI